MLELQVTLTRAKGPRGFARTALLIVKDSVTVFETSRGASEYFRRGWRCLSENRIPATPKNGEAGAGMAEPPGADRLTATELYIQRTQQELTSDTADGRFSAGDECRVFRTCSGVESVVAGHVRRTSVMQSC